MIYPETLLVFRKERKKVIVEAEKEGMFPVVMIEVSIICEYVHVHKCMKSVAFFL